eukprot:TRINITY_DN11541_c0_g1_i5.p1 TRINITY_DN11541_c0_g1~~TRINITY_DN11541_c0_g1_i5.p1  ORF type:complete len:127 (-),score=5.92 TRINITY_DN11541_c0_g1_i5:281-661(-)
MYHCHFHNFSYRNDFTVRMEVHVHNMTEPWEPLYQNIHHANMFTNGPIVWEIHGTWNNNKLVKWINQAKAVYIPEYEKSVYDLVRTMSAERRQYYIHVRSPLYPHGALRGQVFRGFPYMFYATNPC